ncbi:transcription elongation factor GreA [Eggerthia catenaformis OT 569 = DSM 20559]|mgnify:FL=1|uniref:Transcription elongation factor GreA n=1 Tax=Eggerthia catenaformis OT 569 = DSM 20559 TaxID=999415 RepID=M2NG94_9FIRM|nr:transcription elongation factor GreA [Eggerthia catenaformis]EMD17263.1 transcription elongation factor GreA [Eggerthia catenaformis OT 569 = DSM 20559]OUC51507.1 transcription elongation factor GreA [Eggerthia catenaformis]
MDNTVLLTKEGIEKLKEEKEHLVNVERPQVIEEIQLARSQGDLSENADYDAARDKQAHLEARIKEIDSMLLNAKIIDDSDRDVTVIKAGATVTVLDLEDNTEDTYTIVGTFETDPLNGKISNESPLAKAMMDHKVNEIVTVGVAQPYDVKILNIKYHS